jgi:hypothetical protein
LLKLKRMETGQLITDGHMLTEMSMMLTITTDTMPTLEVSLNIKPEIIKLKLHMQMVQNLSLNQQTEECLLMLDGSVTTMTHTAKDLLMVDMLKHLLLANLDQRLNATAKMDI